MAYCNHNMIFDSEIFCKKLTEAPFPKGPGGHPGVVRNFWRNIFPKQNVNECNLPKILLIRPMAFLSGLLLI